MHTLNHNALLMSPYGQKKLGRYSGIYAAPRAHHLMIFMPLGHKYVPANSHMLTAQKAVQLAGNTAEFSNISEFSWFSGHLLEF